MSAHSAYLKFHALERSPFADEAGSKVVLGTKALRDALAAIRSGLDERTARICVSAGPGLGKTSLARALPKLLGEDVRVAVLLDPDPSWSAVRQSVARQWQLGEAGLARSALVSVAQRSRLVLVVDRAEAASVDLLDHLDVLLSHRNERQEPVVHCVLFADLTCHRDEDPPPLLWWLDRIQTLQLAFEPLPRDGIEAYIEKHLRLAGWLGDTIFSPEAAAAVHDYSGGIPGEVGLACERLLREAAARSRREIDAQLVHQILDEAKDETPILELTHELPDDEDAEDADPDRASRAEIEAYLSRPATDEELRAIRNRWASHWGHAIVILVSILLLGGIAFVWSGGPEPGPPGSGRLDAVPSTPPVLARLRGPVPPVESSAAVDDAAPPTADRSNNVSAPSQVLAGSASPGSRERNAAHSEEASASRLAPPPPAALMGSGHPASSPRPR